MNARTDHPVLEAVAARWSPYAYDPRPVPDADLRSIFEAARWSSSSYNEQPWRFLLVTRDDPAWPAALETLVEFNQGWAKDAYALVFAVTATRFERNGKPNGKAVYDLGQATAQLCLEAAARNVQAHQIGGLDPDAVRELCGVPEDHQVVCGVTLGYAARPNEGGAEGRERRALADQVFGASWGTRPGFLD